MLTCKLCGTRMDRKRIRRDGSLRCPECGQIYWKAAVEKATLGLEPRMDARHIRRPSLRSA